MAITIKTHLHHGIYRSAGGGTTRTHYEFTTGPRNLLKAIKTLYSHLDRMARTYGDVGCGWTWLEIDGQAVHEIDLIDVEISPNRMRAARALLAEVAAGYDIRKYDIED